MPGFSISGPEGPIGASTSANVVPFCTYMWEIPHMFGDPVSPNSALVYAKDATLPSYSFTPELVEGASLTYKYASQMIWDDVRVTYYDVAPSSGEKLCEMLKRWRDRIWTPDEGLQYAESSHGSSPSAGATGGYKKTTQITNFTPDEENTVRWTLYGSWPQQVRNGDLTYTDSDVKLVEVVIVYDYAIEDCSGGSDTNTLTSTPLGTGSPDLALNAVGSTFASNIT